MRMFLGGELINFNRFEKFSRKILICKEIGAVEDVRHRMDGEMFQKIIQNKIPKK